jgi:hypothetical protein
LITSLITPRESGKIKTTPARPLIVACLPRPAHAPKPGQAAAVVAHARVWQSSMLSSTSQINRSSTNQVSQPSVKFSYDTKSFIVHYSDHRVLFDLLNILMG